MPRKSGDLIVMFLDAGQGDCTLVEFPDGKLMLVDCGSIKNGSVVLGGIMNVITSRAARNGNCIDRLVLTHADRDHYNLIPYLFTGPNALSVGKIYYGGPLNLYSPISMGNGKKNVPRFDVQKWLRSYGANASPPPVTWRPDEELSTVDVDVYVLAANWNLPGSPGAKRSWTGDMKNRNCIVLMLQYNNAKVFLMADSTQPTEEYILRSAKSLLPPVNSSILKMGHHGSAKSSCDAWIKAIKPVSLFCSSDTRTYNSTGMPTQATIERVENLGRKLDSCGEHSYVVFDKRSGRFKAMPRVERTICTSLYELEYDPPGSTTFVSTGGSWYAHTNGNGQFWYEDTIER
jgi:beta-lactamase superfamily II metal-dependent hydrolase